MAADDTAAIVRLLDAMTAAWNRGDAKAMARAIATTAPSPTSTAPFTRGATRSIAATTKFFAGRSKARY
jgi:hypothetical protein